MKISSLILSGSGTKLPAFCGAIKELETNLQENFHIDRIAATSGGSILAFLYIITGRDIEKTLNIVFETKFGDFFDNRWGIFRDLFASFSGNFGWNKGSRILAWLSDQMKYHLKRNDMNFLEFYGKTGIDLCVTMTNLSKHRCEYADAENTPTLSVIEAIRRSMAIPVVFEGRRDGRDFYVDGGVTDNFPINYFDDLNISEREILGLRIVGMDTDDRTDINNPISYAHALYETITNVRQHSDNSGIDRTINIPDMKVGGISDLTSQQKLMLIKSGRDAAQDYIKRNS